MNFDRERTHEPESQASIPTDADGRERRMQSLGWLNLI
jgi:hypothetical protein